jgi:hypothetical protein
MRNRQGHVKVSHHSSSDEEGRSQGVLKASAGSELKMDRAFVDAAASQAICVWNAPDRASVEALLARAQVKHQSIREVTEYSA